MKNSVYTVFCYAASFFLYIGSVHSADNVIDFSLYPQSVSVSVSQVGNPSQDNGDWLAGLNQSTRLVFYGINSSSDYSLYIYSKPLSQIPNCPTNTPTGQDFISIINANAPLNYDSGAYGKKWKFLSAGFNSTKPVCGVQFYQGCKAPNGQYWTQIFMICPFGDGAINPPIENTDSVCSLNSQDLNMSFSSSNLNVSGLTQNASLVISCSSGDAKNYQLKLTGTNVTNGRLNFGNGVSAEVSLNGIIVQANGTGIQLNNLTSQTIPVNATLTGTAALSGVSNASGVLVLEAQ